MKHLKGFLSLVVVGVLVAHTAKAEIASIVVGDKLFSDFSIHHCSTLPGELQINGGQTENGSIGLFFDAPYHVGPHQTQSSWISYTVSVLPDYDDQFISASTLEMTEFWAASSSAQISSKVYDNGGNLLADLYVANNSEKLAFQEFSTGVKQVRVESIVTVQGFNDVAHLYGFNQTFDQIPEPASMGLIGAGSIFSIILRNKTRKRNRKNSKQEFEPVKSNDLDLFEDGKLAYVYAGRKHKKPAIF